MRIGIDMSRTAETKTGLGSYASSLVTALARIDRANRYLIHRYVWHCFPEDFTKAFCPRQRNFRIARRYWPPQWIRRWWQDPRRDKAWLVGPPSDVFFSPFHSVPPAYMGKLVCTLHDIAFHTHPEFSTDWNRAFCAQQFELARRRAERIITPSQFSKQELVRHLGFAADTIDVVLEAADPRYRVVPDAAIPPRIAALLGEDQRFVLFVGSIEPRKNVVTLVRAWQKLRWPPPLVVAGGSGWKNSDVFAEVQRLGLAERVHFPGFVTDDELVALYNRALAFVYPSIYEGFGLPVVEAMACGAPVVTSRSSSIPEVGGDAVLYVEEPTDAGELQHALERVLEDASLRASLRERGLAQAAGFSWDRAARETLAVFAKARAGADRPLHALEFGGEERALDRGFGEPERTQDGKAFAWIGLSATLRLQPKAGAPFEVEVGTPAAGQRLSLKLGRRVLGSVVLSPGWSTHRFAFEVPGAREAVKFELAVDRAVPPAITGGDPRVLGVMVRRAGFC
jgi:glycosyltransferase involved in cell wall biosynthesis